jgi:hypothetical protein
MQAIKLKYFYSKKEDIKNNDQCSETNVMHFLFNLVSIMGLYMFQALLACLQEALHNGAWYTACMLCQLAAAN